MSLRLLTILFIGATASFAWLGKSSGEAQQTVTEKPAPPAPLKFAPRDYFVAHCQRCHGVDGTNYTPGFATKDTDAALRADIDRMAKGPGNQKLDSRELDVQIALHRLMSEERPFISWTGKRDLVLTGEVTDGAKLTAKIGDSAFPVTVDDDDHWKLTLTSAADLDHLELTAAIGKKTISLKPATSGYAKLSKPIK